VPITPICLFGASYITEVYDYTVYKNDTDLARYNSDVHQLL